MAMRACGACGRKYRGKGLRVLLLQGAGSAGKIVCPTCAAKATPVLTPESTRCGCGAPATACAGCASKREARDQKKVVADLVKKLEKQTKLWRCN